MFSPLLFPPFFSSMKLVTNHNLAAASTGAEGHRRLERVIQRAGTVFGKRAR